MTVQEQLSALAAAILELAQDAATVDEYDGEESVTNGVHLNFATESDLRKIAGLAGLNVVQKDT